MLREIILDTETTGLSHQAGHRIIEIGCLELINHIPTGKHFHVYINPERDVPAESTAITGLTYDFLKDYPIFSSIVDDFLAFIQNDKLVIHNAGFDIGFLNSELARVNQPHIEWHRVTDTLSMARQKFPGSPASLDALCKRFQIDLSRRDKHGALLDSELLAQVYLELLGGRQRKLGIRGSQEKKNEAEYKEQDLINFPKRHFYLNEIEQRNHKDFIKNIEKNLWNY